MLSDQLERNSLSRIPWCVSACEAPKKPTFQSQWMDNKEEVGPRGMEVSELPDSFEDALNIAVECTRSAFETGNNRVRVDFDTTAGDQTYTTLKNSLPLVCIRILISLRTESACRWCN